MKWQTNSQLQTFKFIPNPLIPPPSRHKTRNFFLHFVRFGRTLSDVDRGISIEIFGLITIDFDRLISSSLAVIFGSDFVSKIGATSSFLASSEKRRTSGGSSVDGRRGESETTIEPTSRIKSSKASVPWFCLK